MKNKDRGKNFLCLVIILLGIMFVYKLILYKTTMNKNTEIILLQIKNQKEDNYIEFKHFADSIEYNGPIIQENLYHMVFSLLHS